LRYCSSAAQYAAWNFLYVPHFEESSMSLAFCKAPLLALVTVAVRTS
jgi:hypothetical protein